jgi:hypothetical protein
MTGTGQTSMVIKKIFRKLSFMKFEITAITNNSNAEIQKLIAEDVPAISVHIHNCSIPEE